MKFPPTDPLSIACHICGAAIGAPCRYLAAVPVARLYNRAEGARREARTFSQPRAPHAQRRILAAVALARKLRQS